MMEARTPFGASFAMVQAAEFNIKPDPEIGVWPVCGNL